MTSDVMIELPQEVYSALWKHLVPWRSLEEAAFVFARLEAERDRAVFRYLEWFRVPEEGFESRSAFHLELTDATRAGVIKRAHELEASLIEFHSHTGRWPAAFSPSDMAGFSEFVPHVRWRLRGRPYGAVVVTESGFDGLVWRDDPKSPERLRGIVVGRKLLLATGLTVLRKLDHDERPF